MFDMFDMLKHHELSLTSTVACLARIVVSSMEESRV